MIFRGTTRKVFFGGAIILGFLTICLGLSLFVEHVPSDKMSILASFIPLTLGALGAMKVGDRYVELQEEKEEEEEK